MAESLRFRFFAAGRYHYYGFIEDRGHMGFHGVPQVNAEVIDLAEVMRRTERFTGFRDNDGKDIWEGDVIQDLLDKSRRYVVVYDELQARWGRGSMVTEGTVLFPLFTRKEGSIGWVNLGPRRTANVYR